MANNKDKDISAYEREKQEFIDGLRQFHSSRGTPIDKIPRIGTKEVDLYWLYQRVTDLGGWKKVNDQQLWEKFCKDFRIPKGCLHGDQALRHIYIRHLNLFEKINFLGEDPNQKDGSRDEEGPLRKKQCGPKYGVHLSYNFAQHEIAGNLRAGFGLSTDYAKFSDYDKLEKALLSGLPNEVDFVVNVCTLLSNESKHTLQLGKSRHLTDLLLAHVGIFKEGDLSLEKLYENGWKESSGRDFLKFWYDTVKDEQMRRLISFSRHSTRKKLVGDEILQVGRDLGIEDKEGIRITQLAIIFRNLSFDANNMKYLAANDVVFRFLMLCIHCNYGSLRQLALDTIGNLSAQIVLEPIDSWHSEMLCNLLLQCLTSKDKFAVVRGLEMVSKLSQLDENEYVLTEKLDTYIYQEIAKYLTIQDIQLIVSSLEALYQLSELGEATTSKIAEVSNTVDTLVSLITVEAQSYGPNSLVGIKVVEYCPPPHLTGGVTDGVPGAVGPPVSQAQPPGQVTTSAQTPHSKNKSSVITTSVPVVTTAGASGSTQAARPGVPDMDTTTCNWLQATYEVSSEGMTAQIGLYTDYLDFCRKQTLTQALPAHKFLQTVRVVFPKSCIATGAKGGTNGREVCVRGIVKRQQQLPFAISCQVARVSAASPSVPRSSNTFTHAPTLLKRLTEPLKPQTPNTLLCPIGGAVQQTVNPENGLVTHQQQNLQPVTQPTFSVGGSIPAQGHIPITKPAATSTPSGKPSKVTMKKPAKGKKPAKNILPRPDALGNTVGNTVGNYPTIVPKNLSNTQYTTQDVLYSTIDPQTNAETKVMVKTLLAKKLRQGNVIITQPGVVSVNDINSSQYQGDNQVQLQYQTPYTQPVQQTTYIQYNSPTTQNSVQAIIQPNQTSQLQTFVVQPQVFVQSHPQTSSLQQPQFIQQPIIQQQPVVAQQQIITPQQPIIAQQQTMFTQQPYVAQQQVIAPQVISQPQYVTNYQPQISTSFPQSSITSDNSQGAEYTSQNDIHSSQPFSSIQNINDGSHSDSPKPENPTDLEVCGEMEKATDIVQGGDEARIEKVENKTVNEQSQNPDASEKSNIPSTNDTQCEPLKSDSMNENSIGHEQQQGSEIKDELNNQNELNTSSNQKELDISTAESELESAVGSILDVDNQYESSETVNQESVFQNSNQNFTEIETENEEPVMIENDGNELMFEGCYSDQIDNGISNFPNENQDNLIENPEKDLIEAAAAIEQLEQSQQEQENEVVKDGPSAGPLSIDLSESQQTDMHESVEEEQDFSEMETDNVQVNMVNGDITKETNQPDIKSCLSKFRTDIAVPSIAENGLYEQDFEARMAVENLLKDVEFNVNGDDLSPEENIAVFACQQQSNPSSVQTVNSATDEHVETVNENSQDNIIPSVDKSNESQTVNSCSNYVNGIDDSKPQLSQKTMNCITENGDYKPFMNGNISSPEHQSDMVPSPTEDKKLLNCVSDGKDLSKPVDKFSKLNGIVNHKISKNQVLENVNNSNFQIGDVSTCNSATQMEIVTSCNSETQMEVDSSGIDSKINKPQGDILAQSILENDIQPSDADIPDPEPTIIPVVKQFVPNQIIGNIMTVNCVQINNNAMSVPVGVSNCIAFTSNPLIASKVHLSSPVSVYSSQKNSTSDSALICNKSTSSVSTDLKVIITGKHSSLSTKGSKDKGLTSPDGRPKSGDGKKSKPKKRSRSKSGGSDSRPSSASSSSTPAPAPEYMCEWSQCRRCFDNAKSVFCHVCTVHLKTEFDGLCKWEGCESLVRKRWSLFTHIQDHHCSEQSLRAASQRRHQAFQSGQPVQNPTVPAMVYPPDAAVQAIRRFIPKPPYPEFMEGREGPVTKHIRLTSALILRNLARYSPAGRSLLKKHERVISFTCMSAVESSTALANCLYEIISDDRL